MLLLGRCAIRGMMAAGAREQLGADRVIVDKEIIGMSNFLVGANETDYHYKNVNFGRDFTSSEVVDIRTVVDGDPCPKCGAKNGIEVFERDNQTVGDSVCDQCGFTIPEGVELELYLDGLKK